MDLYTGCLLLGGVGLAAMGLAGLSHSGGHGHRAGGIKGGARVSGHRGHGHTQAHGHGSLKESAATTVLALLSPRVLFGFLLGAGLAGILLRNLLAGALLLAVSLICGLLFERLFISPLWNLMLRFASNPAVTLEGCITDDATAVTAFDRNGEGLISVDVDGQVVQVLGRLSTGDRDAGRVVRAGDTVRIEEVDAARNRCVVSVP